MVPGINKEPTLLDYIEADFTVADALEPQIEQAPKIVAAGRGKSMSLPPIRDKVIELTSKELPNLVYLGTASHDKEESFLAQTEGFREAGCNIVKIDLCRDESVPDQLELRYLIVEWADAILCSGGNPPYALMRWKETGVDQMLKEASERGAVLCGGSAGAVCWFAEHRVRKKEPLPQLEEEKNDSEFVRISGMGYIPALCVPHYDKQQPNGVPRAIGSNLAVLDSPDKPIIGIDENAALVVTGDKVSAVSGDGKAKVYKKFVATEETKEDEPLIVSTPIPLEKEIPLEELLTVPRIQ